MIDSRGGMVHRSHGSVHTSVRGLRFGTISVQHKKKKRNLLCSVVQIKKKNPSRWENTTYYMLYIYIYIYIICFVFIASVHK